MVVMNQAARAGAEASFSSACTIVRGPCRLPRQYPALELRLPRRVQSPPIQPEATVKIVAAPCQPPSTFWFMAAMAMPSAVAIESAPNLCKPRLRRG